MYKVILFCILILQISFGAETDSISNESVSNETSAEDQSKDNSISAENSLELTFGTRIIGGETAKPGQYSFVARLTIYSVYKGILYSGVCSGTILSNKHILTAAHCVYSNKNKALGVFARTNGQSQKSVYFRGNDIFFNPTYNEQEFSNDIAILKHKEGGLTDYGTPPSLPTADIVSDIFSNTGAVVAGWGKTSDKGGVSTTLQYAGVNTITNQKCHSYFGSVVTSSVICTLNYKKGICGGDSGGPLMIQRNGNTYVIGVNAFGAPKCESFNPSGYTYVLPYLSWISSVW